MTMSKDLQAIRELTAKTEKLNADIEKLRQGQHDDRLRAEAHDTQKLLGLTSLGAGIIADRQAKEAAKQAEIEANQVQPVDKYLELSNLGRAAIAYRKSGGQA